MWQREFHLDTTASTDAVWRLFADVDGWSAWNAGIEWISLDGAFEDGATFRMKPPGQDALTSRLLQVRPGVGFEDETVVGDVRVLVDHRVEALPGGGARIRYTACVTGPEAADIGEAVTADFPDVLGALAARAEGRVQDW